MKIYMKFKMMDTYDQMVRIVVEADLLMKFKTIDTYGQVAGFGVEARRRYWNSRCSKRRKKHILERNQCCTANNCKLSFYNIASKSRRSLVRL